MKNVKVAANNRICKIIIINDQTKKNRTEKYNGGWWYGEWTLMNGLNSKVEITEDKLSDRS